MEYYDGDFMKKALIISKTEASIKAVASLLEGGGWNDIHCSTCVDDAKRKLKDNTFELIVVNAPLDEENGLEFSCRCAEETKACIILIVAKAKSLDAFDMVSKYGVMVISKPLNTREFMNIIGFAAAYRKRLTDSLDEAEKLKSELEEVKVINRAKLLLMQCLTMSEAQAHRYIEKQAMNMRTSKLKIAKQVIRTYQN